MCCRHSVKQLGLTGLLLIGMTGCGVWPVMDEANGRRPHAMGKSDQILLPNAPHPTHLSEEYGLAYRQALEHQILHPTAVRNMEPVPGPADPQAVHYSSQRYQLMFENPPFSDLKLEGASKNSAPTGGNKSGSGGGGKK